MRSLIVVFLISSFCSFAQTDKKGTIKVKKVPVAVKTIDSSSAKPTNYYAFSWMNRVGPPSSYGQEYDKAPEFVGGDAARINFVNKNMKCPECPRCRGVSSYSELTFLVSEDGSISEISVKRGFPESKECDEEAIRIVKLMPNWKPAQFKGKNIKIKWDFDIHFTFLK